ncbi:MAG: zinc-ribbon domain-containing protein [Oscillospiraceae bacterium]|nr:zinc-ribbon domain-containing protein [Oscillospiraceae bacterium]
MAYCEKCGAGIEKDAKFCPACGALAGASPQEERQDFSTKVQSLNDTADTTGTFEDADIQQNKSMAILAYLSLLVLVPLFAEKKSPFARYHTNQGLVLLVAEVAVGIVNSVLRWILPYGFLWRLVGWAYSLCGIGFLVLTIIGIANAANGRAKELPLLGCIRLLK